MLGDIVVGVKGFSVGDADTKDAYAYAKVLTGRKEPGTLRIEFSANLRDEVGWLFQARGDTVTQCRGEIPSLNVPIAWDTQGRPKSRQKDKDNLDHFIVTRDGILLQLQTSLVSRADTFYAVNHELGAGRIVQVLEEAPAYRTVEIGNKRYALEPFWESQAYPGADFLATNATVGTEVITRVIADGLVPEAVMTLDIPSWDQPAFPEQDGYTGAIVLWFNPNVGAKVLTDNDCQEFVPLKGILDEGGRSVMQRGGFPILLPRQPVLLTMVEQGHRPFATVRPA